MLSAFRLLRPLHFMYSWNGFRTIPHFHEVRLLMSSIAGGFLYLLPCLVIVCFIHAVVGVWFFERSLGYCVRHDEFEPCERFGTLSNSILNLHMAVSGGDDWYNIWLALRSLGPFFQIQFVVFHAFTMLLVFNVVTAIIIDCTSQRAKTIREFVIHQQVTCQQQFCETMKSIFKEIDLDDSGSITKHEMLNALDLRDIGPYFSGLGIDVHQAEDMFDVLDQDGSGCVSKREFMLGCLRLKGEARGMDVAVIMRDLTFIKQRLTGLGDRLHREILENRQRARSNPSAPPVMMSPLATPRLAVPKLNGGDAPLSETTLTAVVPGIVKEAPLTAVVPGVVKEAWLLTDAPATPGADASAGASNDLS